MKIDFDVVASLRHYVQYGLHPGSFGYALLTHNTKQAYETAHPMLTSGEDVVANMITFVGNVIPNIASGSIEVVELWMEHEGLTGADAATNLQWKLSTTYHWVTSEEH